MNFEDIRDALEVILINAESVGTDPSRYRTISGQRLTLSEDDMLGALRTVNVYYKSGNFPKSSGTPTGPTQHDLTIPIEFMVAAEMEADLVAINNPESTAAEIQIALAEVKEDYRLADRSFDELFSIVYQIIMDARNIDLNLPIGVVTNRWLDNPEKDDPVEKGAVVVITGTAQFTCRTEEDVPGDEGNTPDPVIFDNDIEINNDSVSKAGARIDKT